MTLALLHLCTLISMTKQVGCNAIAKVDLLSYDNFKV